VRRFPSQSIWRGAIAAAFVSGLAARAPAQEPAHEKLRLEYRAPQECPDGESFRALVRSRVLEDWEARPEELARRMDVAVSGSPSSYVATIEFVDSAGKRITRAVRGAFCPDVVEAIALVTALAIQSRGGPAPEGSALGSSESASEPPPPAPATEPTRAAAVAEVRAVPPKNPHADSKPNHRLPGVRLRASARAAIATAIGPRPAPGAGLGVVLERRSARFGVAFQGFWSGRVEAGGVPAHFELLAARFEGCPFVPQLTRSVSIEPCAFAELGRLTGEANEDPPAVVRGFPGNALWLSTGAAARMVGRLGPLTLELEGVFGASLRRERFTLDEGRELYKVPAIYGALAAGLGVLF
jgi:hypothetical protein